MAGDGQSVIAARKVRMTFAIVVPVLIAIGVVAVAVSAGSTTAGKQKLTAATSRFLIIGRRPFPMPTTPPAATGTNCTIVVPAQPLSAQGLATPYKLAGAGCTMANTDTQAFVQATIIDPATGVLSVYEPLVITQGTTAAVAPVVPTLPAGAVVTIDFGFNGDNLTLVGANSRHLVGQLPPPGPLRQWPARLDLRAGLLLQRSGLLQGGERGDRGGHADGPCGWHRE